MYASFNDNKKIDLGASIVPSENSTKKGSRVPAFLVPSLFHPTRTNWHPTGDEYISRLNGRQARIDL